MSLRENEHFLPEQSPLETAGFELLDKVSFKKKALDWVSTLAKQPPGKFFLPITRQERAQKTNRVACFLNVSPTFWEE